MVHLFQEALSQFPQMHLVLIGEVTFFVIFVGMLVWIFRKGGNSFYDKLAALPMDEEGNSHER